jgi:predicted small lipoprotein YifL
MKKIFALLLAVVTVLSMAACGANKPVETTPVTTVPPTTEPAAVAASALEILETVWAQFGEDEKFFVMGGDFDNMVDGAPGKVTNSDFIAGNLLVPADQTANITDVASLLHAMNANTFTCAAYAVADVNAFATAMQTAIQGNQWMCGFPEKLLIAEVGGYVVVAFGHGDAVNPFQTKLTAAYPTTQILVDEPIA